MADVIGAQAGWVWPFALATGLGACAGLIGLCRRDRASAFASARLMLAAWFVLPTLALVVTGVVPFIHYFIILFPLAFLGLAAALEWFAARGRYAGLTLLALILGGYAWQDAAIFRTIAQRGGAPGDYGVAYAYKAAAMRYAAAANAGQRPILFDGSHPGTPLTPEYRFLVDLALREGAGSAGGAAAPRGFVLLDLSKSAMTPAGEAATRSLARRQFGPLTLFELPLAAPPPGS